MGVFNACSLVSPGADFLKFFMEPQSHVAFSPATSVKVSICLGSEMYTVHGSKGTLLSEQLVSMKEESMTIFKDYITKHNAPADVPDEPLEGSSGEEDEIPDKPKSKKRK